MRAAGRSAHSVMTGVLLSLVLNSPAVGIPLLLLTTLALAVKHAASWLIRGGVAWACCRATDPERQMYLLNVLAVVYARPVEPGRATLSAPRRAPDDTGRADADSAGGNRAGPSDASTP